MSAHIRATPPPASGPAAGARRAKTRRTLGRRASWRTEVLGAAAVYGLYELSRGLLSGDAPTAIRHAREIADLERSMHLFIEPSLQRAAHSIPVLLELRQEPRRVVGFASGTRELAPVHDVPSLVVQQSVSGPGRFPGVLNPERSHAPAVRCEQSLASVCDGTLKN